MDVTQNHRMIRPEATSDIQIKLKLFIWDHYIEAPDDDLYHCISIDDQLTDDCGHLGSWIDHVGVSRWPD